MKQTFDPKLVSSALHHIEHYWFKLERFNPHDEDMLIGLPRPYIVPSANQRTHFAFEEMYYWDSYFIAQGLWGTKREQLAFDMLENLLAMAKRFRMIPNGNRFYLSSRSQPPLLTTYILEAFSRTRDRDWLAAAMVLAKDEYRTAWMGTKHPHWRQVFKGLSRYYDVNVLHELAEAESGWDMNPRFGRQCMAYLPIDLNSLLYKYETDFALTSKMLGDKKEATEWEKRATRRRHQIDEHLWDEKAGFYFDFNYRTERRSPVWSLAGYYPLWSGLATAEQAQRLVNNLSHFEHAGGLATTSEEAALRAGGLPLQWQYPNGWAPLHWLVIGGLERYGYHEDARRIARKWLNTNLVQFARSNHFLEKYNVVRPTQLPKEGLYPLQIGFSWTNAVFYRLAQEYLLPEERLAGNQSSARKTSQ